MRERRGINKAESVYQDYHAQMFVTAPKIPIFI
jgi:hypothetical protein